MKYGFVKCVQHVDGIRLKNVKMTLMNPDERPEIFKKDVRNMTVE